MIDQTYCIQADDKGGRKWAVAFRGRRERRLFDTEAASEEHLAALSAGKRNPDPHDE